jgi:hypothetical protein
MNLAVPHFAATHAAVGNASTSLTVLEKYVPILVAEFGVVHEGDAPNNAVAYIRKAPAALSYADI